MALNNVTISSPGGQNLPAAMNFPVAAGSTAILAGEPCKWSTTFAIPSADAEPVTSAPTFLGIATSNSTQTASVAGTVDVLLPVPGVVYTCKAKSAAAVDTAAELLALQFTLVAFDLTAGVYTVETASAGATNGLVIVGGDIVNGTVNFVVRQASTFLN